MEEQFEQANKPNKTAIAVVISIIITAIVIGGGVFFWQQWRIKQAVKLYEKQNLE